MAKRNLALALAALAVAACGGEEETSEDLLTEPTFANVRAQVFQGCAGTVCHDSAVEEYGDVMIRPEGEHAAAVHAGLVTAAAYHPDAEVPIRVVPGAPERSYLMWKLLGHSPENGTTPLRSGEKMPQICAGACPGEKEIELVRRWIEAGAPLD